MKKSEKRIDREELSVSVVGDFGFRISAESIGNMGIDQLVEEDESPTGLGKLRGNGLLVSAIILYALTCETAMKILIMEGEGDTHDLELLFGRLTEDVQTDIRQRVVAEINGDFDEMLSADKSVQDSWQRFYKGGVTIYEHYVFLKAFAHAINIHCTEVIKRNFSGMNYYLHDDQLES